VTWAGSAFAAAAGLGALQGAVTRVRSFGPVQRAEVLLAHANAAIEIDAPRDQDLRPGDVVGLSPRRYRIFEA
jgi:sulfate/thiosulfate transport system ATP-binding protein